MNTTTIVILNDNQTWGNIAGATVLIDVECNSDAFDPGTGLRISIEELVNTWQAQQREIAQ